MIYFVSTQGNDGAAGTAQEPFRTINHAASLAVAGDTVRVYGGIYREWVDPQNGGNSEDSRIVYEAVPDGTPIDFTRDYAGAIRGEAVIPGPFATVRAGEQRITVWKR